MTSNTSEIAIAGLSLLQRHRPARIQDFIGLEKTREFLTALAENPFTTSLLFVGDSGLGKSTMAHAFAAAIPAQPHHVPARACDQQRVEDLVKECHYVPSVDWRPVSAHVGIIDEADAMTTAAQIAFLSVLDGTTRFPNPVIFIFTANSTAKLDWRFRSRSRRTPPRAS
jgi:DNA polymerase III delta prime subunit